MAAIGDGTSASSSSDSTDEEERQRLCEAVVTDLDSYFFPSSGAPAGGSSTKKSVKSRSEDVSDDDEKHPYGTTPGFRAFMRKKFTKYLDSILEYTDVHRDSSTTLRGPPDGDCPLFTCCSDDPEEEIAPPTPKKRKKIVESIRSSDNRLENERIAEAAVSWDFLFPSGTVTDELPETSAAGTAHAAGEPDNASEDRTTEKRKKKKKKKKKHKGTHSDTPDEEICAIASSDERLQSVHSSDLKRKKKKKRKRRDSSDGHAEEAVSHNGQCWREEALAEMEIQDGCTGSSIPGPTLLSRQRKKSSNQECSLTAPVQSEREHPSCDIHDSKSDALAHTASDGVNGMEKVRSNGCHKHRKRKRAAEA